jgi:DNA replication licensing factor MCM3
VVAAANPVYGTFDPSLDLAKNIGLPDSLLSRFDLVFVVRDLTTEEIDRRIAEQVVRQASQRIDSSTRRGVEQVHSNILQRQQEADTRKTQEATEVFERRVPGPNGEEPVEVITVDFLRKYIRFCRRLTPVLTEEAQAEVAEKYCDMRMRFQTGLSDSSNPDSSNKKPRLAVTTRTLEALIRLSTAHAKLKLRKHEVLPEDVHEAYKLMMAAREEDVPSPGAAAVAGPDDGPDTGDQGSGSDQKRGQKRSRQESGLEEEAISAARVLALTTLVARVFARRQSQQLSRVELFEAVNGNLMEGELPFEEEEFQAGLDVMEARNKILLDDSGEVMLVA